MQNKIEQLIKESKLEEAFAILKQDLEKPLTPEDKGRFYAQLIAAYAEANNNVNAEYIAELQEGGEILREIKAQEDRIKREDIIQSI